MGAAGGPYRVVDIITEGSSLTNFYYGEFHKMLTTAGQAGQGYAQIVTTLKSKLPAATAVNATSATLSVKTG